MQKLNYIIIILYHYYIRELFSHEHNKIQLINRIKKKSMISNTRENTYINEYLTFFPFKLPLMIF